MNDHLVPIAIAIVVFASILTAFLMVWTNRILPGGRMAHEFSEKEVRTMFLLLQEAAYRYQPHDFIHEDWLHRVQGFVGGATKGVKKP